MPLSRAGKKAAVAAAAGIRPSDTLYMGLLTGIGVSGRNQEASASGYSRQVVTFTEGSSPNFTATQSGSVEFNFNATSANITGTFLSTSASDATDTAFQDNVVGYQTGANLSNVGDGSVITVSNASISVTN